MKNCYINTFLKANENGYFGIAVKKCRLKSFSLVVDKLKIPELNVKKYIIRKIQGNIHNFNKIINK